jgi:hypothetical protein
MELCSDELYLQDWRPQEGSGCEGDGETVEARRVNLEDEVGKAKQEEQIDPLGRV